MTLQEYLNKKDINAFVSAFGSVAAGGTTVFNTTTNLTEIQLRKDGIVYISASLLRNSDFMLTDNITMHAIRETILAINERVPEGFVVDGTMLIHLAKQNNIYTLNVTIEDIPNKLYTGQRWVPVYEEVLSNKLLGTDIRELTKNYQNKLGVFKN